MHIYQTFLRRLKETQTASLAVTIRQLVIMYNAHPKHSRSKEMPGYEDTTAVKILQRFHSVVLDNMSPRATLGDGNCAYRALSLALYGTQNYHVYARLLTACEIIENLTAYDRSLQTFVLKDDRVQSPHYAGILIRVLNEGRYTHLIHVYAMSSAFNIPIQSYVPPSPVVGLLSGPYNCLVTGRDVRRTTAPSVTLMWTMASVPQSVSDFKANHVVFLAQRSAETVAEEIIDAFSDNDQTTNYDSASSEANIIGKNNYPHEEINNRPIY
jgi:hypothetical protein